MTPDPPQNDPHANFRAEVACYSAADPMPTMRNLSELTGVPLRDLIRYVLVKYAASASDALLSLDPIVFRQMREHVARAEQGAAVRVHRHPRAPCEEHERQLERTRRHRLADRVVHHRCRDDHLAHGVALDDIEGVGDRGRGP